MSLFFFYNSNFNNYNICIWHNFNPFWFILFERRYYCPINNTNGVFILRDFYVSMSYVLLRLNFVGIEIVPTDTSPITAGTGQYHLVQVQYNPNTNQYRLHIVLPRILASIGVVSDLCWSVLPCAGRHYPNTEKI